MRPCDIALHNDVAVLLLLACTLLSSIMVSAFLVSP